jgi:hypothetical protein
LALKYDWARGNIHRTTWRAEYPNAVMMYIINHVNVLLANEIHFALRSTVGGRVSKARLPQRVGLGYLHLWERPRSRRI